MRLQSSRSWRPLLALLALLLLLYAGWGLYRNWPDFNAERAEPATIRVEQVQP